MKTKVHAISAETQKLGEFMAAAPTQELPEAVVEIAKHHILDTLAAIVSGSRLWPGRMGIAYASGLGGVTEAGVIGSEIVTTASNAAFAAGICAHSDETDDSHYTSRTHPGSAIVSAAVPVAQKMHASGTDLIRAVVLGYDVGTRLVHALDMIAFQALYRSCHSYGGTFGAGAASGALHHLDQRQMRHLLSYCAQYASGCGAYMHDEGHIEKAFVYAGKSAQSGVNAAALVSSGFTACDDVFSGERNFLDAYGAKPSRAPLVAGLGSHHEIVRTNIKKWCVGSPIQAALDGLEAILRQQPVKVADVESLVVEMDPKHARTVDNRPMGNINIQHMLSVMLTDGTVTFASAHDDARMSDPSLTPIKDRIRIVPKEELAHVKPPRQTIVTVNLRDGKKLSHHVIAVRGTADNRMERDEVVAKARDLMAPVLGKQQCEQLITELIALERVKDVSSLQKLLAAPTPSKPQGNHLGH